LCLRNDMRSRVVVITSPGPGEGKTTVVSNLAATLAQLGNRCLVIDSDLRRPRLHEAFDLVNTTGLSTLLTGPELDGTVRDAIRSTTIPGLFVMPSGIPLTGTPEGSGDVTNLLGGIRMRNLIRRLRHEFDIVLIDAPPALLGADARIL